MRLERSQVGIVKMKKVGTLILEDSDDDLEDDSGADDSADGDDEYKIQM
jgi:hypothetical protein